MLVLPCIVLALGRTGSSDKLMTLSSRAEKNKAQNEF